MFASTQSVILDSIRSEKSGVIDRDRECTRENTEWLEKLKKCSIQQASNELSQKQLFQLYGTRTHPKPQAPEHQPSEQPQAPEPQPFEPQASEPQPSEPQPLEPQASEPKPLEPQASEPKPFEPQAPEPQASEPQSNEPQAPEPQQETKQKSLLQRLKSLFISSK